MYDNLLSYIFFIITSINFKGEMLNEPCEKYVSVSCVGE